MPETVANEALLHFFKPLTAFIFPANILTFILTFRAFRRVNLRKSLIACALSENGAGEGNRTLVSGMKTILRL